MTHKFKYIITADNIHIIDSYKYSTKDMIEFLNMIKGEALYYCKVIQNKSFDSLIREWQAHNLLYNLHLFRNHTKDVDLNIEPWYKNICYYVLSLIYRIL